MQVNYTADAFASLAGLVNFIESKNTAGAGIGWLDRYEQFLHGVLVLKHQLNTSKDPRAFFFILIKSAEGQGRNSRTENGKTD